MKITYGGRTIEMAAGEGVLQCLLALGAPTQGVLAVQQGGRVLELGDAVRHDGALIPLTLADEEAEEEKEKEIKTANYEFF